MYIFLHFIFVLKCEFEVIYGESYLKNKYIKKYIYIV